MSLRLPWWIVQQLTSNVSLSNSIINHFTSKHVVPRWLLNPKLLLNPTVRWNKRSSVIRDRRPLKSCRMSKQLFRCPVNKKIQLLLFRIIILYQIKYQINLHKKMANGYKKWTKNNKKKVKNWFYFWKSCKSQVKSKRIILKNGTQ